LTDLQQLRNITDEWSNAVVDSLKKVPYGVRYIIKELRDALVERFPDEDEERIIKALGFIFYYRYLNPIIVQPDAWDVIEKDTVSDKMMRNLTEVSKMLQAISVNKHFTEESVWLQPLNEYISIVKDKFFNFLRDRKRRFVGMLFYFFFSLCARPLQVFGCVFFSFVQ
jgi:hypothetical protein